MSLPERKAGLPWGRLHLPYRVGPFLVHLETPVRRVVELARWFYGETPAASQAGETVHFNVRIEPGALHRRWLHPQVTFHLEDACPFSPFPADHAFALLEWGLNWSIAVRAQQYLMLHAAVLERDGQALLLPAVPGSGKSTLAAALALRGWRLLSDEFGLVDPGRLEMLPLPRPIPLKNRSIEVIREFSAAAELGPTFPRTRKGDVAHMRPPGDSLRRQREAAKPTWIVFPRYRPGSALRREAMTSSGAFVRLSQNSFNYRLIGARGFTTLSALIRSCRCWQVEYSDLEEVVAAMDELPIASP